MRQVQNQLTTLDLGSVSQYPCLLPKELQTKPQISKFTELVGLLPVLSSTVWLDDFP